MSDFWPGYVAGMVRAIEATLALLDPDNDILIVRGPIAHACDMYVGNRTCQRPLLRANLLSIVLDFANSSSLPLGTWHVGAAGAIPEFVAGSSRKTAP
jgi:hypothetical protein